MRGSCLVTLLNGLRVKRCSGCRQQKPLDAFTLGSGPGGYHRHCRDCCKAYREKKREQQYAQA